MNETFSRSQTPSGGWQYYIPQTGWSAPTPIASTFDQTVQLIIKHLMSNGAIVVRHKLATDPVTVGNQLETYTRQRLGIPGIPQLPKTIPPRSLPQAAAEAVAAVAKTAEGVGLLIDWLGGDTTGNIEVVAPDLAHRRAQVCCSKDPRCQGQGRPGEDKCIENNQSPFTDWFTVPVAERLRKMVEARQQLKLTTPVDDKLGTCAVCRCPMKLKVHVPLHYIYTHTKPETLAAFPAHCWIATHDK